MRGPATPRPPADRSDQGAEIDALYRTAALVESSEDPIIGLTLDGLYGGEELLVLLAEQDLEGALVVCERMRAAVHRLGLAHADNEAGVVTISIGVAACPDGDQADSTDAIGRADRALYAAKANGRNRVVADR